MMSSEFFDDEELKNLPPLERAKFILKKKEELEKQIESEAATLEKESQRDIDKQQKELLFILEEESSLRRKIESESTFRQQNILETTIDNSPESRLPHNSVEYGPNVNSENSYSVKKIDSPSDELSLISSPIKSRKDGLGHRLYSESPKKDYI